MNTLYVVRFPAEKAELSDSDHLFQTYVHKSLENSLEN